MIIFVLEIYKKIFQIRIDRERYKYNDNITLK